MRIAYYHEWSGGTSSGVFKKIVSQVNYWKRAGHQVVIFNLSACDTKNYWIEALDPQVSIFQTIWSTRLSRFILMDKVIQDMMAWSPDLVYRRYGPYYPSFERVLGRIPLVLEINTNDLEETKITSMRRYYYLKLTRGRLISCSSGLVFVANQIMTDKSFRNFKVPKCTIANGGDLSSFPATSAPNNTEPNILFIGTPKMVHHGTDKIFALAQHFDSWKFHLIGPTETDFNGALPKNVSAYGLLNQDEYLPIVRKADVAIGSLALYRVNLDEASPLKMSEYLGLGIPVVIGYKDTNFMEPVEFILELPSHEHNVQDNFDKIEAFVQSQMGKRVPRNYIKHIDVTYKEKKRLEFFEKIIQNRINAD